MTGRLPPHDDQPVTNDELDAALDDDAPVRLDNPRGGAVSGPHGLCLVLTLDVSPTMRLAEAMARAITQRDKTPKRLRAKRRKR